MSFVEALDMEEIPPGSGKSVEIGGVSVAVLRSVNGEVHAVAQACPHGGYPMSEGLIEDDCVECLAHGVQFDLRTGASSSPICGDLKIYPVQARGNTVLVDVA